MSHIATAPHECKGHFIFVEYGLSPYWAISNLLHNHFDGHGEIEAELDGEHFEINLGYQYSGFAPRPDDSIDVERLKEFNVHVRGDGQRKAQWNVSPRFRDMRHYETGELTQTQFHVADEGVNVHYQGSNLEPDEYLSLFQAALRALFADAGTRLNRAYLRAPHGSSTIYEYERYVRLNRGMYGKIVGESGVMRRLVHLLASEKGIKAEFSIDNETVIGKQYVARLPKEAAQRLHSSFRYGKQIKGYLLRDPNAVDETHPSYHPKIGVLYRTTLNSGNAFDWSERHSVTRDLDTTLINVLSWSDVPVRPDPTTFVPDDHFDVRARDSPVRLFDDPTPRIEAEQDALIVRTLRDFCASDEAILRALTDGGQTAHPAELADRTGYSIATVYRAIKRLDGLIQNDNASVRFATRKMEQDLVAIVKETELQLDTAAHRLCKFLGMDPRYLGDEGSAWQRWVNKWGVEAIESDDEQLVLKVGTMLSRLKSTSLPKLETVLKAGSRAWRDTGGDPLDYEQAMVKWTGDGQNYQVGIVSSVLR